MDIFNRTINNKPDFYQPDFGGKIFDLPVIIRQFDTSDSIKTIYIYSGIPIEFVDRRNYTDQNRIEADLQKGIFVFNDSWSSILKDKKSVTLQFSQNSKFPDRYFLSVDSLKVPSANYNLAVEFFDTQGKNLVKFRDTLKVIDVEKDELGLSDIILAKNIQLKTSITQINRTKMSVTPNFEFSFLPGQDLFLYYEVYNLEKNKMESTKYQISHIIRGPAPKSSIVSNIFSRLRLQQKTFPEITTTFDYEGYKSKENLFRIIQLKDYEQGKYQLVVRVMDLNTKQIVEKTVDFKIEK